jgi:hypothetical protein
MGKWGVLIIAGLFLIGFAAAISVTSSAIKNNSNDDDSSSVASHVKANTNNANHLKNITTAKNRIKATTQAGECPVKCTCTGSVTKCQLNNGTREMTVTAGKSGNMIVQVKGINASTKVTLYKSEDGKVYAVFKGNVTKRIRMLPDQVRERIRERIKAKLEDENITLNEDGNYSYQAKKRARLFFIFPVRVAVQAEINSETGEVTKTRNSWWAFLAKDEKEEELLGASCGTVTPGYNDQCCQNKGYDVWNSTAGECEFSSE